MDISKKFNELLEKLVKEQNCTYEDVFVKIDGEVPTISLWRKNNDVFEYVKQLDIQRDVLGLKIDFIGKSQAVLVVLYNIIGGYTNKYVCERTDLCFNIHVVSNEDKKLVIDIEKNNQLVETIKLDDLLNVL